MTPADQSTEAALFRSRKVLGSVSLLVLVTLTVASSAAAIEPMLLGLQDASAMAERGAARLLPPVLARAMRGEDQDRTPAAIVPTSSRPGSAVPIGVATVTATDCEPTVWRPRVELMDLPPPRIG